MGSCDLHQEKLQAMFGRLDLMIREGINKATNEKKGLGFGRREKKERVGGYIWLL